MEVIWTRQAIQMVNDFVDYIAQDDYETAEQWALGLMSQTDKINWLIIHELAELFQNIIKKHFEN